MPQGLTLVNPLLFSVNDVNKLEEIDSTFQILSFSVSITTQHHIDISNQVDLLIYQVM